MKGESGSGGVERHLRAIFEFAALGIAQVDPDTGQMLRVNRGYERITGFSRDELLEMTFRDLTHPEDRDDDWQAFRDSRESESTYRVEKRYVRKDGTVAHVRLNVAFIPDAEGRIVSTVAICEDVTDVYADRRERTRLMRAVEQAGEAFILADEDGHIEYVNPAFEAITGYSPEEVLGRNPRLLKSGEHGPEHYREIWDTLSAGSTWRGRIVNRRKDGSLYTTDAVISPVVDDAGRTTHYVAVQRDMSERLEIEDRLSQAEKLESIGRLAGGVAHDFNNMLSVIVGSAELALEDVDPDSPIAEQLREIRMAARRSSALTGQLLAFARQQQVAPRVVDLNETVESMLQMLQRMAGGGVDLRWRPERDVLAVHMDPVQVHQILANLTLNARDAIGPDPGYITIETGRAEFDAAYCRENPGFREGRYVLLAVSDDGEGMAPEVRAHVFEPFFTTKPEGKGTGLGLATVYGITRQNDGFVKVYSEPGEGSTFRIYLPERGPDEIEAPGVEDPEQHRPGGFETILFVEDDAAILRVGTRMLEQLGYTVLPAGSPDEALKLEREFRAEIHLLITDVVLPRMSGRELARAFDDARPGRSCLFVSGYTAHVIEHRGVLEEGVHFLQKPFTVAELARAVRHALGKA